MLTRCSLDEEENKLHYYRGKHCIEKLCKKLKERVMRLINYKEKTMIQLTNEENKSYKEQEACRSICLTKIFVRMKMMKIIKIEKRLKINDITQENLEVLLIAFAI